MSYLLVPNCILSKLVVAIDSVLFCSHQNVIIFPDTVLFIYSDDLRDGDLETILFIGPSIFLNVASNAYGIKNVIIFY